MTKALIMAGGTGGHVFPALAVAQALRADGWQIEWMGTERGIEARLVPEAGILLHTLQVQGVRGKGIVGLLLAPFNILRALFQAHTIIARVKPDLVLGFGGFASGPGGLVARLCGIPLVIHEQNARPGTTNKLLAPIASRVLQGFDSGLSHAERVGNPVRPEICQLPAPDERYQQREGKLRILVVGGSLGAQFFNQQLPEAFAQSGLDIHVIHQTGERWLTACQQAYAQAGFTDVDVVAFIDDMARAYAEADLVICRAGALTVSELACAGVAALLVPFPFAIDDHQTANAQWLVASGGARLMAQAQASLPVIVEQLQQLCDRARLRQMACNSRAVAQPDASVRMVNICQELVNA